MSAARLTTNAMWALLSHLLSRGSLILAAMILARALTTSDFVVYSYYQMTVSMLGAYAALGLGATASRYFAEEGYERPGAPPAPIGTLCVLSLLVSAGAFVVVLLVPTQWLDAGLDVPRWLLAAGVASMALGVIPGGAILGLERYRNATLISALSGALMLVAALWAASEQMPELAIAAIVVTAFLQAAGQFAIAGHVVGWTRMFAGFGLHRRDVRRVFGFAGPMLLVSLMAASGSWLVGRVILRGQDADHAFALYSIGLQWFSLALLLPGMISRVVLPRLVRLAADAQADRQQLVRRGALLATGAAIGMTALGVVLGPWLIAIYGANYDAGRWFLAAYLGAAIFSAPVNTLGNAILAHDGQWIWFYVTIAWLCALLLAAVTGVNAGLEGWTGALSQTVGGLVLGALAAAVCRRRQLI